MLLLSLRMTWRDWRAGELRFLLVALLVAVAALAAVGFFASRMGAALERDAAQLLGADLVVDSDARAPDAWRAEAARRHLRVADAASFPTMLQAGAGAASHAQLVMAAAVTDAYPLRGRLKLNTDAVQARDAIGTEAAGAPAAGTIWVDPGVLTALQVRVGQSVRLGERSFTIGALIAAQPDRGAVLAGFLPIVLIRAADLAATGLVTPDARVNYRLQVAAPDPADQRPVAAFAAWLKTRSQGMRGVHLQTLDEARPEMRATLDRAERFLALVGLMSALLAAVAVAMAARRFMLRHLDACAMLRCLGLTQNQVAVLYLSEFLLVGLAGSALGVVVGWGAHFVLAGLLAPLFNAVLPPPSWVPAAHGLATGLVLLLGFALPPVLQLRNVPHNRVLRREQAPPQPLALATYGLGAAAFGALLFWQAGDGQLAAIIGGGFGGGFALFALAARAALALLRRARTLLPGQAWRFAVTSLQRRPAATVVQVVALALGLMALLVLTVVRADLLRSWRAATPPDAPNHFMVNIEPDQQRDVAQLLARAGVPDPVLYPMIRGRLVAINGRPVTATTFVEERARRLAEREFNLSTMAAMQPTNRIVAGRWFRDGPGVAEASVEQGLAKTLHLTLGERLRFDIAGQTVEARITSLRKLEWGSMRANFFVILNPAALADVPRTFMTAYHQGAGAGDLTGALTRAHPNLTVIDVTAIVRQVQTVLDQVVRAVQFLFAFTLAAGVLVLYAALLGTADERRREAGLLRALGATRGQLLRAQWIEFALVGALAGVLAAGGAAALGWALTHFQFHFDWTPEPLLWLAGLLAGMACALAGGWLGVRDVLAQPPLQTLREA